MTSQAEYLHALQPFYSKNAFCAETLSCPATAVENNVFMTSQHDSSFNGLPEDLPHRRFATQDSPQRRFATQRVRHTPNPISRPNPPDLNPPDSNPFDPTQNPRPKPPTPTPRPNPPDPTPSTQPITVVWRIFHIGTVANICCTYAQVLGHIRCVANLLCGESSVANLLCGESSGHRFSAHWSCPGLHFEPTIGSSATHQKSLTTGIIASQ